MKTIDEYFSVIYKIHRASGNENRMNISLEMYLFK